MRILVTGGAGFIGSHVAEAFIDAGHEVVVVDDLSTGRESNIPPGADFERVDIREDAFETLLAKIEPQAIAHLAAQIDVRRSVTDPVQDAAINVLGTVRLARAAVAVGCAKVIFSSTGGAIYGEQEVFPATEEHPCRPVSPYGTSKLCGEHYLFHFERSAGPVAVSLRYANVYGPRQDPHGEAGVVAIFSRRMLRSERPIIYGDGAQSRDYVYVSDVARANLLALRLDAGGVYNVGTGVETDVNRLAGLLAELTAFDGLPEYAPPRPGEQRRSCIDPSRAARELGWEPSVNLREGLARTVEFFRHNLDQRP